MKSIGGRYSALSNFGMVPAAAMGLDVERLLDEAERMVHACAPGVPAEDWESVFEAFVRASGRRGRGSGIGLYAARRLMEAMGGRIWIEGNGFGGSRFVVALPAVAPG